MAEFSDREFHIMKRALAIATLAVEREGERSCSGAADIKLLLTKLVESDVELLMYVREARVALGGLEQVRVPNVGRTLPAAEERERLA